MSINFSQIHPQSFAHPADQAATAALKRVPFVPELLKLYNQFHGEERYRAYHMKNSLRLGATQLPTLWRMAHQVAERLGVKPPRVFVSGEGGVNAFAFGLKDHTIVLTRDLVDLMTDRELEAIIAHELAHIICQHMLYRSVGMALASPASSSMKVILTSTLARAMTDLVLVGAFQAWSRAAEYTADRAAVLVMDDPEPLASCLSCLAGVPRRFMGEFDLESFAQQFEDYEAESTAWSRVVCFDMSIFLSHPEPVKRAVAAREWAESEEYRRIRSGDYKTIFEGESQERIKIEGIASCPLCGSPVGDEAFCSYCQLPQDASQHQWCERGHLNASYWNFCRSCGIRLASAALDA